MWGCGLDVPFSGYEPPLVTHKEGSKNFVFYKRQEIRYLLLDEHNFIAYVTLLRYLNFHIFSFLLFTFTAIFTATSQKCKKEFIIMFELRHSSPS